MLAPEAALRRLAQQLRQDALGALRLHRRAVVDAMLGAEFHPQQAQEVPQLGGGGHGALAPAPAQALLDGDGGRNAPDRIHLWPPRWLHDAAGVGVEAFQVTALAFVEQDIERQRRFARAGHAGDDAELAAWDLHAQRFEVVLAGVDDADGVGGGGCGGGGPLSPALSHEGRGSKTGFSCAQTFAVLEAFASLGAPLPSWERGWGEGAAPLLHPQRPVILTQRLAGVRSRVQPHILRRARGHDQTARITAFRPQIDEPIRRTDHIQVVLDHQQRVPRLQQPAQGAHQLGDVVEVQAGGRFVEHEELAFFRRRLARAARSFGQMAGQLQALCLTAGECRHRLPEAHIVQPHIDDGLQAAQHVLVLGEAGHGFTHRQFQHVGDGKQPVAALDRHFAQLGAEAFAVAVRAAQVHVRQELHFDMLETRTAASRATAIAGVEAEHAGGVAALLCQGRSGKQFADLVKRADVTRRVRTRRFADGRLIDEHHTRELLGAQQAIVLARRFGGLAEVAQQRGHEHVLHQGGFAGA